MARAGAAWDKRVQAAQTSYRASWAAAGRCRLEPEHADGTGSEGLQTDFLSLCSKRKILNLQTSCSDLAYFSVSMMNA